jgi:GTP pyrophosphokinase
MGREKLDLAGLPADLAQSLARFDSMLAERIGEARRLSGESEINHPRRMVNQMIEDGIRDKDLLLATVGHDAVEDGYMTLKEIGRNFGREVRNIIDGETKLSKDIESIRRDLVSLEKWIEAAYRDPRVIILKAYDSFDNWRDQHVFLAQPGKEGKPREHAEETLLTYVPMMRALSWFMRVRLEDRALEYFDPNYAQNIKLYEQAVLRCDKEISEIAAKIKSALDTAGIKARVVHGFKPFSEIYNRCKKLDIPMKALFKSSPLYAHYVTVVVEENDTVKCHDARGLIDEFGLRFKLFMPETDGKNNLLMPRENNYRSLHTYASLPGQGRFILAYTTRDFDLDNHFGVVAEGMRTGFKNGWAKTNPVWLRRLRDLVREKRWLTAKQIRDKIPKIASPITVRTPQREAVIMDEDSTALDFALSRDHLNVGSIYVNGVGVKHDHGLRPGDVVEVRLKQESRPRPSWLLSVHTHEAAGIIRQYLRSLDEKKRSEIGEEALSEVLRHKFLEWQDVRDSLPTKEVVNYFLDKYQGRFARLVQEGLIPLISRNEQEKPKTLAALVGLGEIDIEEFTSKFDESYRSYLEAKSQTSQGHGYVILFTVAKDRIGIKRRFGVDLESIGMNTIKDATRVNEDGSATLAYVFRIFSPIQERQIEYIVRGLGGQRTYSSRPKEGAMDFNLIAWLEKYGIVI